MNEVIVQPTNEGAVAQITPMQMLSMAVSQGADIDKLDKLMQLQERWEKNEARKAFVVALNEFKANAPKIIKDKKVSFGNTKYSHALAGSASEEIGAELAKHGMSHRWDVEQVEGRIKVTCILTHSMGHSERVTMEATPDTSGSKNSIQAIGSTVSYLQRYSLFAATGLVPKDADDDAHGGVPHKMHDSARSNLEAQINALTDKSAAETLWKQIAAETTKSGDVEAYAELRGLYAAKLKTLKTPKAKDDNDNL